MNGSPRISYISQFFILLGLTAGGFLFASVISLVLMMALTGTGVGTLEKEMLNPENANAIRIVQLVGSCIMFFLPAIVFSVIVSRSPGRHLGLKTKFNWVLAGLAILMVFVAFYLSGALAELTNQIPLSPKAEAFFRKLEKSYMDQVMIIANMKSVGDYLFTLIVIGFAPAIFEEILFRGAMQQLLIKWSRNAWVGIIITSLIFSVVHFSYYGFLSRFALGIMLGFMFHYSKSLWLPIIAHFVNNGVAVTMMYYTSRKGELSPELLEEKFPVWWGAIALAVLILLFVFYRKESKRIGTYYSENFREKADNPF